MAAATCSDDGTIPEVATRVLLVRTAFRLLFPGEIKRG